MHSPPSSPGLFFSSPPNSPRNGPEDEVEALFASAHKVSILDHSLRNIIDNNRENFLNVFGRQVQLLKSRSQAFEDAHVTVYDKVLLLLTENGNDLESPAAITWYCAEYLGYNPYGGNDYNAGLIGEALALPTAFSQALTPSPTRKDSGVTVTADRIEDETLQNATSNQDPRFTHLWSVYRKAHSDYLNVADKHNSNSLDAAKFLRDTAENGIHYLRDKHPNHPALAELSNTYTMAKLVVLDLNGGRKRKFDRAVGRRESYPPHTTWHNRANAERRRRDKRIQHGQGREKKRGRGPSGIPYGYTRPVDSYYPA